MREETRCTTDDDLPPEKAQTLADRIVAQADAGRFPLSNQVLSKLQGGDFELGGLNFKFKRLQEAEQPKLHCAALVGYLPYTAEQKERRAALQTIIRASNQMRYAHLSVSKRNTIQIEGIMPLPITHGDEDVMLALLSFYQEARPLLKIVAGQFQS
ncbi:MAG: hypothetical protein KBA75_02310 [Alphaproteobacteria bacterium]|nr:hypothetical protein [Alphaproteobacteria bacterium]